MKLLILLAFFSVSLNALCQSKVAREAQEAAKVKVYVEEGKQYNKAYRDSLLRGNFFVREKRIRSTDDTIYYSLTHFDKSLFASSYSKLDISCKNSEQKSIPQILNTNPYNKIAAISLVSFKKESDTTEIRKIPESNGRVDMSKMFEQKRLSEEMKNSLLDILVNYGETGERSVLFCIYEPRNAVVFLDKDDNPMGYVEICFQCLQYLNRFENIQISMCDEKFDIIQGFFMHSGIGYGMNRNERD